MCLRLSPIAQASVHGSAKLLVGAWEGRLRDTRGVKRSPNCYLIAESLIADSAISTVLRVIASLERRMSHEIAHAVHSHHQLAQFRHPRDKIITDDAPAVPLSQSRNSSARKHNEVATQAKANYRDNKQQAPPSHTMFLLLLTLVLPNFTYSWCYDRERSERMDRWVQRQLRSAPAPSLRCEIPALCSVVPCDRTMGANLDPTSP